MSEMGLAVAMFPAKTATWPSHKEDFFLNKAGVVDENLRFLVFLCVSHGVLDGFTWSSKVFNLKLFGMIRPFYGF